MVCYTPKHTLRHSSVLTLCRHYLDTHTVFDTLLTYSVFHVCCCVSIHIVFQVCPTHSVFGCVHILSVNTVIHCSTQCVLADCLYRRSQRVYKQENTAWQCVCYTHPAVCYTPTTASTWYALVVVAAINLHISSYLR